MTEFGELTKTLFAGLGAVGSFLDEQAADTARGQALTVGQFRLRAAQQSATLSDARLATMKQRLVNEELGDRYEKAVETERLGLLKILADATPEDATKFLKTFPFIDPKNRGLILRQHGRTIAGLAMDDATKTIVEYFSRPGVDPAGITVEGLMNDALIKHEGLPAEAKLAFQGTFIGQAQAMITGQIINSSYRRQADATKRGEVGVGTFARMWLNGTSSLEDVQTSYDELEDIDNKPRSEFDYANRLRRAFTDALQNYTGRPDELLEKFNELPESIREIIAGVPKMIERRAKLDLQAKTNKARDAYLAVAGDIATGGDIDTVDQLESHLALMPDLLRGDPDTKRPPDGQTISRMRKFLKKAKRAEDFTNRARDAGLPSILTDNIKRLDEQLSTGGTIADSVETLRALRSRMGSHSAFSQIAGSDYAQVGKAIIQADTDAQAAFIAQLFDNPQVRARYDEIAAASEDAYTKKLVRLGKTTSVPDPQLKITKGPNFKVMLSPEQLDRVKNRTLVMLAQEIADGLVPPREAKLMAADAEVKIVMDWRNRYLEFGRRAVEMTLFGDVTDFREVQFEGWIETLETMSNGADASIFKIFEGSFTGMTYVPAFGASGRGAFLEWDPDGSEHAIITEPNVGDRSKEGVAARKKWEALMENYRNEYDAIDRVRFGDFKYHHGMPSRYIGEVDATLFGENLEAGYWKGALKPRFEQYYQEKTGEFVPFLGRMRGKTEQELVEEYGAIEAATLIQGKALVSLHLGIFLRARGYHSTLMPPVPVVEEDADAAP